MSDKSNEYDILFRKFYSDLFKYQTGKKNAMKCKGCNTDKRFIINNDELIFSCGPKNNPNKKCGIQYTIKLPKYVKFSDLYEVYNENIHGSMKYSKDLLGYDLETLSQKMNVSKELESQKMLIKDSAEKLKRLTEDYIQTNHLDEYIETLETLSEKRNKNSYEKSKIKELLKDETLSEPEKKELKKKYAVLVNENKEFMDMIIKLRKPNTDFICVKTSECIHNDTTKESPKLPKDKTKNDDSDKLIDLILDLFTANDGKLTKNDYRKMIKREGFKTLWGKTLFNSLQKGEHSWKSELQETHGSIINPPESRNPDSIELASSWRRYLKLDKEETEPEKYTYEEQIKILIEYYHKVDPSKSDEEIKGILNRRRPKGFPIGTRIPTEVWLKLCDKLNTKYNLNPLEIND